LLADDDADDANLFCEALTRIAPTMKCLTVENGRQAFELLSEHQAEPPHVIFLDINMPIMDGWECLRKLKENSDYQHIPVIMYSTSSARKDIEMAYNLGALLFLTKPEDFHELCEILKIVATNPQEDLLASLRRFESVKIL
jgi:CheY-like chemotaxis protein